MSIEYVIKRDGSKEIRNDSKQDRMTEYVCKDLSGVDVNEVKRKMSLALHDGVKTSIVHETLTDTLRDMISLETPNYTYAASRSSLVEVYKDAYGSHLPMNLLDLVKRNIKNGHYEDLFKYYTEEEFRYYGKMIEYDYDKNLTYLGIRTMRDKYLITDKKIKKHIEGPQEIFMLISMMIFSKTKDEEKILRHYRDFNDKKIAYPSPVMSGLRTPEYGYASCCVIEPADTKEGISATVTLLTDMGSLRAGIGVSTCNIRGSGAGVRRNTIIHTGKVTILKWFEVSINPFVQGSRGNSANNINAIWDWDVEKILTLKSNKSTEENSVKGLTYSFLLPRLLFKRAMRNEDWTLFSAEETRLLMDNLYNTDLWEETYITYEQDTTIRKKTVSARELMERYAVEFFETGRIHPIFISNANEGPFSVSIRTSNLCVEIFLPTVPIRSINDPLAELPLCILGNVNMGFTTLADLPRLTYSLVLMGNLLIDKQKYPNEMIRRTMMNGRYLGLGVSDMAHYIAMHKLDPRTKEAKLLVEEYIEHFQFNLIKASNELAKIHGEAKWFREKSEYANNYITEKLEWKFIPLDEVIELNISVMKYGLYNLSLSAIPPAGTSADISGSTNGLKIPLSPIYSKATSYGQIPTIVPDYEELKDYYVYGQDVCNEDYIDLISGITRMIDQGASIDIDWFETDVVQEGDDKEKFKLAKMMNVLFKAQTSGLNSLYYSTFNDKLNEIKQDNSCSNGGCSI